MRRNFCSKLKPVWIAGLSSEIIWYCWNLYCLGMQEEWTAAKWPRSGLYFLHASATEVTNTWNDEMMEKVPREYTCRGYGPYLLYCMCRIVSSLRCVCLFLIYCGDGLGYKSGWILPIMQKIWVVDLLQLLNANHWDSKSKGRIYECYRWAAQLGAIKCAGQTSFSKT